MRRILSEKYGGRGLISEKLQALYADLTKEWKQPPVVILQHMIFCNIVILCLWVRMIGRFAQGV